MIAKTKITEILGVIDEFNNNFIHQKSEKKHAALFNLKVKS